MKRFGMVCVAAVLSASPVLAQDAQFMPFVGEWAGVGEGREGANAPWERASCEIAIEWQRGLRSYGVCEGARGRFSAGGLLTAEGGDFLVPHFVQTADDPVAALEGGNLVSTYTYEDLGVVYHFRLTVRPVGPGQMTMTTELLADGRYIEVGRIALTAR